MIHYRKFLAVSLTAAMAMGNSVAALAADQEANASGTGELEYVAVSDVFNVVFPTVAEDATTFDYILDPEGLIDKTEGAKYGDKTFEEGKSLYFLRSTQVSGNDYTDTSDEVKVVNKSTQDVNLVVKAKVEAVDGIKMAASTAFGTDSPELYLAVKGSDGTNDETTAITTTGVDITKAIVADTDAYEISWDGSQYVKGLKAAAQAEDYAGFKSYTFQLTGACNSHADWATLKDKAPKVDLIWSVKDFTVTGPQVSVSAGGVITVSNLTAEKNYSSMKITDGEGTTLALNVAPAEWNIDNWDASNGGSFSVTLGDQWVTYLNEKGGSALVTVTLSDSTTITGNGTLTQ